MPSSVEKRPSQLESSFPSSFAVYMKSDFRKQCDANDPWIQAIDEIEEGMRYSVTFTGLDHAFYIALIQRNPDKAHDRRGEEVTIRCPIGVVRLSQISEKKKDQIHTAFLKSPGDQPMDTWLTEPEPLRDYAHLHPYAELDAEKSELHLYLKSYTDPLDEKNIMYVGWHLITLRRFFPDILTHIQQTFGNAFVPL